MNKQQVFDLPLDIAPYKVFIKRIIDRSKLFVSSYVCVANVHMLIESYKDENFATVVRNADFITPDGIPVTWALRLLHGVRQERVAGMDLLPDILKKAEEEFLPVYFYGGTDEMLQKTSDYIKNKYPSLKLAGVYSPPFRPLKKDEEDEIIKNINDSGCRIVFVVLGCPKQEKWMASMKGRIFSLMIGIGGALPVLIGMQTRAPVWMQKSGLEWFYRLIQDPKRLWKRYFITNSIFLYLLFISKVKVFFQNRKNRFWKSF